MKQTDFVERLTQALDLRVRASRHSLLGQSAYSSGLQEMQLKPFLSAP